MSPKSHRAPDVVGTFVLAALGLALMATAGGAQQGPSFVPGRVLVQFQPGTPPALANQLLGAAGGRSAREIPGIAVRIVELHPRASEANAIAALNRRPEVAFAEPDAIVYPERIPNDPRYKDGWHLPKIETPAAWGVTIGDPGVVIAILDTGVDDTHPDLAGKLLPGWNFYNNSADTRDGHGHGTAVAGAAAASTDNGLGVAAVGWSSSILPVRVAGESGGASLSAITQGLVWAADQGARVANISYRVSHFSSVSSAAEYFQSKGGVVTVAAGNQSEVDNRPSNPYLLTISATDSSDRITSFSNTGEIIDLAAPGVSIATTANGGGYRSASGTSFSAPVTAGVAALVISVNPALTARQIQDVLKQSADDLGPKGWDPGYGWGRVNADRAVRLALDGAAPPSDPDPGPGDGDGGSDGDGDSGSGGDAGDDTTPPTVQITYPADGATVPLGQVDVTVNATDDVGVVRVDLYVNDELIGNSTQAPFTVRWNSRKTGTGTHRLQAVAYDAAGNAGGSPQVTVTVASGGGGGGGGNGGGNAGGNNRGNGG